MGDDQQEQSQRDDLLLMTDIDLEEAINRQRRTVETLGPRLRDLGEKLRVNLKRLEDEIERRKFRRVEKDDDGCKNLTQSKGSHFTRETRAVQDWHNGFEAFREIAQERWPELDFSVIQWVRRASAAEKGKAVIVDLDDDEAVGPADAELTARWDHWGTSDGRRQDAPSSLPASRSVFAARFCEKLEENKNNGRRVKGFENEISCLGRCDRRKSKPHGKTNKEDSSDSLVLSPDLGDENLGLKEKSEKVLTDFALGKSEGISSAFPSGFEGETDGTRRMKMEKSVSTEEGAIGANDRDEGESEDEDSSEEMNLNEAADGAHELTVVPNSEVIPLSVSCGPVSFSSVEIYPEINELNLKNDLGLGGKQADKMGDRKFNAHQAFEERFDQAPPQVCSGVRDFELMTASSPCLHPVDAPVYVSENRGIQAVEVVQASKCALKVLDKMPVKHYGREEICQPCLGNVVEKKSDVVPNQKHEISELSPKSWADIVASNGLTEDHKEAGIFAKPKPGTTRLNHRSFLGSNLEYIAPKDPSFPALIEIEDDLIDDLPWGTSLVGHFLDEGINFGRVRATAMTLWRSEGLMEVFGIENGFFFFEFNCQHAMECVLEKGPWHFSGKLLILRKWRKRLRLTKDAISKIPVWVKFYDLPLEFWNAKCLSRIASAVGVPLFLDMATDTKKRISFARVCIEVDASKQLIHSVSVRCEGETIDIPIEYQGLPPRCSRCYAFGHETTMCKSAKFYLARETGMEENSGGETDSVSAEWVKVKKRKNVFRKKNHVDGEFRVPEQGKQQEKKQERTNVAMSIDHPVARVGFRVSRQGSRQPMPHEPVVVQSADQPGALAPVLAGCSALSPSPASQASLLIKAIEGSDKLGNSLR